MHVAVVAQQNFPPGHKVYPELETLTTNFIKEEAYSAQVELV